MYLKVNDEVLVMRGADKGKKGRVMSINRAKNTVKVEGVRMVVKHQKPRGAEKGQLLKMEADINASNVMLLDPESKKPTRVAVKVDGKKKERVSVKSKKPFATKAKASTKNA